MDETRVTDVKSLKTAAVAPRPAISSSDENRRISAAQNTASFVFLVTRFSLGARDNAISFVSRDNFVRSFDAVGGKASGHLNYKTGGRFQHRTRLPEKKQLIFILVFD